MARKVFCHLTRDDRDDRQIDYHAKKKPFVHGACFAAIDEVAFISDAKSQRRGYMACLDV